MRDTYTRYRDIDGGAFGSPIGSPHIPGIHTDTKIRLMLDKWCTQLPVVAILWCAPYQHIGSQGVLPIAKCVQIKGYTLYMV